MSKKNIFIIVGSASENSSNEKLVDYIANETVGVFKTTVLRNLKYLPHFDPEMSNENPPQEIIALREHIVQADGIIICTPEYVFSIPSGLKNVIEWCVSTVVLSDKPVGLITASAHGQKGHEELKLIMKTVMAKFTDDTTLLISGVKGKVSRDGQITDTQTRNDVTKFIEKFKEII